MSGKVAVASGDVRDSLEAEAGHGARDAVVGVAVVAVAAAELAGVVLAHREELVVVREQQRELPARHRLQHELAVGQPVARSGRRHGGGTSVGKDALAEAVVADEEDLRERHRGTWGGKLLVLFRGNV